MSATTFIINHSTPVQWDIMWFSIEEIDQLYSLIHNDNYSAIKNIVSSMVCKFSEELKSNDGVDDVDFVNKVDAVDRDDECCEDDDSLLVYENCKCAYNFLTQLLLTIDLTYQLEGHVYISEALVAPEEPEAPQP